MSINSIASVRRRRKPETLRAAVKWLRRYLSDREYVSARRVYAAAARRRISKRTLERAKSWIGWKSYLRRGPVFVQRSFDSDRPYFKNYHKGIWFWVPPGFKSEIFRKPAPKPEPKPGITLKEVEALDTVEEAFGDLDNE